MYVPHHQIKYMPYVVPLIQVKHHRDSDVFKYDRMSSNKEAFKYNHTLDHCCISFPSCICKMNIEN